MLLNLTDVFTTEGKSEEKQVTLEWESFSYKGQAYPIVEMKPVVLRLTNLENGKAEVKGSLWLVLNLSCDRCLEDVPYTFELSFVHTVLAPTELETDSESEEESCMEGYQLNVESLVANEIMLNWPMKILCREDCKGLCSVCGKNLNDGECGCDTFVPDPRMAKIQEIFRKDKEV